MTAISTLTLTKVWVNRVDTGEALSAPSSGRSRAHSLAGEVRSYAGGRQRSIVVEGERGTFAFTLLRLTLDQVETLRSWTGVTVQVRDHRGQRFFGVYYDVGITEYKDDYYSVSISLATVTTDEGV